MRSLSLFFFCACAGSLRTEIMAPPVQFKRDVSVTVFGVFHDGRVDVDAWRWVEPRLAASFNRAHCSIYYSDELGNKDPLTFTAISDLAREEGLGAQVLSAHGAGAPVSDVFAIVEISGKLPPKRANAMAPPSTTGGGGSGFNMGGAGGGRRGGRAGGNPPVTRAPTADPAANDALELSVLVYDRPKMQRLASVRVRYTGDNEEDAWDRLNQELRTMWPDWRCNAP